MVGHSPQGGKIIATWVLTDNEYLKFGKAEIAILDELQLLLKTRSRFN